MNNLRSTLEQYIERNDIDDGLLPDERFHKLVYLEKKRQPNGNDGIFAVFTQEYPYQEITYLVKVYDPQSKRGTFLTSTLASLDLAKGFIQHIDKTWVMSPSQIEKHVRGEAIRANPFATTFQEHSDNLDMYRLDMLAKWEITSEIFNYFLCVLPPKRMSKNGFVLGEGLEGNVWAYFSQEKGRYYCEFVVID